MRRVLILLAMLIVAVGATNAAPVKIFSNGIAAQSVTIPAKAALNTRVIAQDPDPKLVAVFEEQGCEQRHLFADSVSFSCPQGVIVGRPAKVYHISDLEADAFIRADQVWAEHVNGDGVIVAVLDTGIDAGNSELSNHIVGQKDFVENDNIAQDPNGHGTHVAGIITATGAELVANNYATGVAPGAQVYMLRVCDETGRCYEDDLLSAMEYVVQRTDAQVVSMSLGGGNYQGHCDGETLAAKANWMVDQGLTVVAAAGNDGLGVGSPACASKAIAVGATDKIGRVQWWSNRNTALDIVAPGRTILSTFSCEKAGDCSANWYAHMSGTSMATPHIAGVAALLLQENPTLSDGQIKQALYATATPASSCLRCTRWWRGQCLRYRPTTCTDDIQGAGIVDAYGAYQFVQQLGCSPSVEVCDGADNDCDGAIDEDTGGSSCTTGRGACVAQGTEICIDGALSCDAQPGQPQIESCNTIDDDCDGEVDESLSGGNCATGQLGLCSMGAYQCSDGVLSCTALYSPVTELCDGADNDCDGDIDESCATCIDTDGDGFGVGCALGPDCDDANAAIHPQASEICNNIDDNCNLATDEDLLRMYGSDIGECVAGEESCVAGSWLITLPTVGPQTETCDGKDNDCDSTIDETCGATLCWDADYQYLKRSSSQLKKFCMCAQGSYAYKRSSRSSGKKVAYSYMDSHANTIWDTVSSTLYYPAYKVMCDDEVWYYTNDDYYA